MNIKDLEYYQRLVYEKSFSKVADFYQVSQPTITYAIKRLETELNVTLLERDRSHKNINLTPAGWQFSQHVNKILRELRIAKREMSHFNTEQIPFGLPPIIGNYYFPKLSKQLLDQDILQHLKIIRDGSENLLRQIRLGQIDIGIIGSITPLTEDGLKSELLKEKKFQIIVAKNHPLASKTQVAFRDLLDENFVLLSERYVHLYAFQQLTATSSFEPHVVYQSDDLQILKSMIKDGVGIGLLAEIAIQPEDNLLAIDLIDDNQPLFYISMVQRSAEISTPLHKSFTELIRRVFMEALDS